MEQPVEPEWIKTLLLIVAAISSFVAAVVGVLHFLSRHGNPTVIAKIREYKIESVHQQRVIRFHQPSDPSDWLVTKVKVRQSPRKSFAKIRKTVLSDTGDIVNFELDGDWGNEIIFNPPISEGKLLLHPDAPEPSRLWFDTALRSRPRIRRSVLVFTVQD